MTKPKPFGIIYKATNLVNSKCYIGQTISGLSHRKRQHKCESVNNYSNMVLSKSIRKYGWDNFEWEIIYECNTREELDEKEVFYIDYYNSRIPNGYNLVSGGKGISGFHWSEESKQKQRERNMGKILTEEHKRKIGRALKGRPISEEQKIQISNTLKGHNVSLETREKISKATKGKKRSPFTEEHRKKLSEARKGIVFSEEHKRNIREANKKRNRNNK